MVAGSEMLDIFSDFQPKYLNYSWKLGLGARRRNNGGWWWVVASGSVLSLLPPLHVS